MKTIEELAVMVQNGTVEDEASLAQFADVENATFAAYYSDYAAMSAVCKGCHEGGGHGM